MAQTYTSDNSNLDEKRTFAPNNTSTPEVARTDYSEKPEVVDHENGSASEESIDRDLEEGGGNEEERAKHGVPVSKVSTRVSVNNVSKIPNGGWFAWMQVAGSFFIFFNTWGIMNTFGVYQTQYEIGFLKSSTPSSISWIGSIQSFLLMLVGALTGPVYDAGYFRELLIGGSFLIVFGHMMLSLCTKYWEVLLAQAFCIGIGAGCLFVPGVAIISQYFHTKLALATGLAAAGSSLGGVIYPIVLHRLVDQIGFGWAVRVIGFLTLATLLIPNFCMKQRVLPTAKRPLVDVTAFKSPEYVLFVIGGLIGFMGLYTVLFYVQLYAIRKDITNENLAFYLLSMLNAASTFGRILPNFIADKTGALNIIVPCAFVTGILILCLIPITSVAGIIILVLLFGFFSGSFVSLPPTIIVHMTKNRGLIGTRMGMAFAIIAIGVLIGSPIAGVILDAHGFTSVWIFGGVFTLAGAALFVASRVAFKGWDFRIKA